ncbi:MAG: M14 family zinc carboxypeptidase [Candidatus Hodarchaeota archaeon]
MRGHQLSTKGELVVILIVLFSLTLIPAANTSVLGAITHLDLQLKMPSTQIQTPLTLLYPGEFHDYFEMEEELANFQTQAPDLIDLEIIGQSYEGLNITCVRITNETDIRQKAKSLIVAHHHGREQITVEVALRFILRLLNNYEVNPTLTNFLNNQEIFVIPSLNPDTLEHSVNHGDHWLRKNLRPFDHDSDGSFDEDGIDDVNGDGILSSFDVFTTSDIYLYSYYEGIDNDADGQINEDPIGYVDLNRNYPTGFGNPGSSNDPYNQVYHGPTPFSEPETQAFRDFALNHRFAMAFSLHSGINATYFPSDQYNTFRDPILYPIMYNELDSLLPSWWNAYNGYALKGSAAYLAAGDYGLWQDWMFEERGTAVPICFEIYNNASSISASSTTEIYRNDTHYIEEWTGIYGYFNPVTSAINELWHDIIPAFDYLLQQTPRLTGLLTGKTETNESITLTINLSNLSPRLSTIEDIEFRNSNGTLLHTIPALEAGHTVPLLLQFPTADIGSNKSLWIGNNYTGYIELPLTDVVIPPPIPGFPLISIIVGAIVAMGTLILIRRKHRSTSIIENI